MTRQAFGERARLGTPLVRKLHAVGARISILRGERSRTMSHEQHARHRPSLRVLTQDRNARACSATPSAAGRPARSAGRTRRARAALHYTGSGAILARLERELPDLTSELGLLRLCANKKEVSAFGTIA
jgi:hypothetical protein